MIESTDAHADGKTTAWITPDMAARRQLEIITYNDGDNHLAVEYDLSPFAGVEVLGVRRSSFNDYTVPEHYVEIPFSPVSNHTFSAAIPPRGIVTISAQFGPNGPEEHDVAWAGTFDIAGASGYADNPDGDALLNLAEYGYGGAPDDPNDPEWVLPRLGLSNGGAPNRVDYIFRRRTDAVARGLTHTAEQSFDLRSDDWITVDGPVLGTAPLEAGFEAVTNRLETSEPNRFIRQRISIEW
jgi:hypothetical protein